MRISRRDDALIVETPAKLNLHLEVLGRRDDGFHDLETVMVAVSLCDTLLLRPALPGQFVLRQRLAFAAPSWGPAPPTDDRNLVLRAARALAEATGTTRGVEIELLKRIPWQAGLGGGSSDAAATLWGLNQLWGLQLAPAVLHRVAATLGSDLNFFVARTPLAVCTGRGEHVQPYPLRRRLDCVIAQPPEGLSTAAVFRHWQPGGAMHRPDQLLSWLRGESALAAPASAYNALQSPALVLHSGVARLCRALAGLGATLVSMTGSGSACFGVCRSRRHAAQVASRVRRQTDCLTWVVQTQL